MNPVLCISKIGVPSFLKRRILGTLFEITKDSFSCSAPDTRDLDYHGLMELYLDFSQEVADDAIKSGKDLNAIGKRLFQGSYQLGSRLKNILGIKNVTEGLAATKIIYEVIGIDFEAGEDNKFIVSKCYFSDSYSPKHCKLMSNLDRGLVQGLTGGSIRFDRRISEGAGCCSGGINYGG